MRPLLACIILVLGTSGAHAREPHCTLRAHLEANANDGPVFSMRTPSLVRGKDVTIEKVAAISERDVVAFKSYPATDGTFGATFKLNDHGRLALDSLSVERRGTFLYVFVNGRAVAELQIDRRVSDGQLYVASGLTPADLALMRKEWPPRSVAKKSA